MGRRLEEEESLRNVVDHIFEMNSRYFAPMKMVSRETLDKFHVPYSVNDVSINTPLDKVDSDHFILNDLQEESETSRLNRLISKEEANLFQLHSRHLLELQCCTDRLVSEEQSEDLPREFVQRLTDRDEYVQT